MKYLKNLRIGDVTQGDCIFVEEFLIDSSSNAPLSSTEYFDVMSETTCEVPAPANSIEIFVPESHPCLNQLLAATSLQSARFYLSKAPVTSVILRGVVRVSEIGDINEKDRTLLLKVASTLETMIDSPVRVKSSPRQLRHLKSIHRLSYLFSDISLWVPCKQDLTPKVAKRLQRVKQQLGLIENPFLQDGSLETSSPIA